jgi:hypothetical protein
MTITGERSERAGFSRGQVVQAVSGLLLAIAFFLPWVNTGVSSPSGLSIASGASVLEPLGIPTVGLTGLLYLVPVLAIVALALAFLRQSVSGLTAIGAATLAFLALVVFLVAQRAPATPTRSARRRRCRTTAGLWIALLAAFGVRSAAMMVYRFLAPSAG